MMLLNEGARKEKKGLEYIYFLKNLVDLLKSLVATAYVDCTAYAPCKRLCVEYTTFARKRLIAYVYSLCARGDFVRTMYVRARKRLNAYVNVRLLRVSYLCARSDLCVRCTTCAYDVRLNAYVNVQLLRV